MGLSSSQPNSQDDSHFSSEQITSEKTHDIVTERTHSESSEQKNQLSTAVVQNEPGETCTMVSDSVTNEKLKLFSEDVVKISFPEHVERSMEDVSELNWTNNNACTQQTMSGKIDVYGSEFQQDEASEQNIKLDSQIVQNKPGEESGALLSGCGNENLQQFSENFSKGATSEHLKPSTENASESGSRNLCKELGRELSEQNHQLDPEIIQDENRETSFALSYCTFNQTLQPVLEDTDKKICYKHSCQNLEDAQSLIDKIEFEPNLCHELVHTELVEGGTTVSRYRATVPLGQLPQVANKSAVHVESSLEAATNNPTIEPLLSLPEYKAKDSSPEMSEIPPKYSVNHSAQLTDGKNSKTRKNNRMLRNSDRVLRSRSHEKSKAAEVSNNVADASSNGETKRRRKRKKRSKRNVSDEYSRIRTHLRYLLNRINYEQSLITAYSTEGWKGLSLEKLKPEKELQRATSEILRRKLKIRDLFQHLDSLCAEGRLPESLFDSEGEIDSEDIFCAKCGSKDLSAGNDIILCDGACDRGFHQYCLDPPLLNEDIPPDDEGWLCPGCDCKVDCIDLLNDSQGTSLSINNSWEKVFPEAAATGHTQNHNFGLPSDDSDDNDYNPDNQETDEKDSGNESSSNESDFTSASEELEVPLNEEQCLGLPSDDSEDDDFDPDAPDNDETVKQESSSSDFTSDSEDLATTLEENRSYNKDEDLTSVIPSKDSKEQSSRIGRKKESMNNDRLSILESAPGQDGSAPVNEKRSIERLDYKKLYDETYGNFPSGSSDDEDWSDASAPRKKKKSIGRAISASRSGDDFVSNNADISDLEETEHKPRRTHHQKANSENTSDSPAKLHGGPSRSGSSGKGTGSSAHKRLGEAVKQKLYESFKVNQYPDRATKESLAADLGITAMQVSKWFANTRWFVNHPSSVDEAAATNGSGRDIRLTQTEKESSHPEQKTVTGGSSGSKTQNEETYGSVPSSSSNDEDWSDTSVPRKRKKNIGRAASVSRNGNDSASKNAEISDGTKQDLGESEPSPRRAPHQQSKTKDTTNTQAKLHGGPSRSDSSGKRSSAYRRLGETVKQKLYESFRIHQYPDRSTKESLAAELGITVKQVSKWFENSRWCFNHSSSARNGSERDIVLTQAEESPHPEQKTITGGSSCSKIQNEVSSGADAAMTEACSEDVRNGKPVTPKSNRKQLKTQGSRKRKRNSKVDN
ncbi:hypothetical protein SLEP1_g50532 [Rubroshorea leprosula]|uniref:Uncharacterized protein n=1 Tax=Rubroshorea leprosula TaxID=152421 RepID=A0AAV5M143_9ROSI|nr:hypothetical protein SLEP1_g50532 [Rubroshorea leprosula]